MKGLPLAVRGVVLFEPRVITDERGFFFEAYNRRVLETSLGRSVDFVQENNSGSARNVLRGLHYQVQRPQAKLVRVTVGEIFDVTVDLRRHSDTFGRHVAVQLSARNRGELWIPEGCAHGYLVLSDYAEVAYQTTEYWSPDDERCIAWNDPRLAIAWPLQSPPTLSPRDAQCGSFEAAETFA